MKTLRATRTKFAFVFLFVAASLPSHSADHMPAAQPIGKGDTVLVTINGHPVRRALFDGLVKARSERINPYDEPDQGEATGSTNAPAMDRKAVFDDLVIMEIMAQKAHERGIHLRSGVIAEAELQYKTLLQQELVRELIAEIRIEPAEVLARYEAQTPERSYKVSHILLKSEQEANAVIGELDKGARFQSVARKRTLDSNTKTDGMLGWMMASQLEQPFAAAADRIKPGSYSRKPVRTRYGWHVILLHAARYLDKPPFASAQTWLRQEILHEKVSARIRKMRQDAKVEVPPLD